jgi:hypothetical protein
MKNAMLLCVLAGGVVMAGGVGGCTARLVRPMAAGEVQSGAVGVQSAALSAGPELAPLGFMAGRWAEVTARGVVQEEHWSMPRGRSMMGMFRRVLPDGRVAFHEIVSVTADDRVVTEVGAAGGTGREVMLRLRHFHGKLEAREGEEGEIMVMRLGASGADGQGRPMARFDAVAHTRGVRSVTYTRIDGRTMDVSIVFEDASRNETIRVTRTGE